MSKLNSHCLLLLTLVCSTAQAPSFIFWRNTSHAAQTTEDASGTRASFAGAGQAAALPREFAEEGDIKRFQLDEMYLPKLDVTLPELFNWSELDREYVANADESVDGLQFDPDNSRGASLRMASLVSGPMFAGSGGGGSNGNGADPTNAVSSAANDSDSTQPGKGDPSSTGRIDETAPSDTTDGAQGGDNTGADDPTPDLLQPVAPNPEPDPVPVPAPGAVWLFALGLAGLQLAGRKKKQKRLAAS